MIMTNNLNLRQIYKRETPFICSYHYKTDMDYMIKVTTIDIDTHISAEPICPYSLIEVPSILFTSKEGGTLNFSSNSLILSNNIEFLNWVEKATNIYEFIQEHFEELAKGEIEFDIEESLEK